MEGKNIYLSVFPEFLGLLSFCLLKLTKNIDLQVMRETMMFRIRRLSLSTGWNKKICITLSTVASSVTVKPNHERLNYFWNVYCSATNQIRDVTATNRKSNQLKGFDHETSRWLLRPR